MCLCEYVYVYIYIHMYMSVCTNGLWRKYVFVKVRDLSPDKNVIGIFLHGKNNTNFC